MEAFLEAFPESRLVLEAWSDLTISLASYRSSRFPPEPPPPELVVRPCRKEGRLGWDWKRSRRSGHYLKHMLHKRPLRRV